MTELVIWAQSVCRSTMALYREMKRMAGVPVTVVVRKNERGEWARQLREAQGQGCGEFADVVDLEWDGEEQSGRGIFAAHCGEGAVHRTKPCGLCLKSRLVMLERNNAD